MNAILNNSSPDEDFELTYSASCAPTLAEVVEIRTTLPFAILEDDEFED
jgi:hypothetical protein